MKQIKCPNCGAKISAKSYMCDYCGTELENTNKITTSVVNKNQVTTANSQTSKMAIVILIVFLIAWVGIGVFMMIQIASNFSLTEAIPAFLITFVGFVSIVYGIIFNSKYKSGQKSDLEEK